jgi:hypothetical protein
MSQTETYIELVEHYAALWHDGRIPADRVTFIAKILDAYMPESQRTIGGMFTTGEWLRERDMVAAHLAVAADCVGSTQETRSKN